MASLTLGPSPTGEQPSEPGGKADPPFRSPLLHGEEPGVKVASFCKDEDIDIDSSP